MAFHLIYCRTADIHRGRTDGISRHRSRRMSQDGEVNLLLIVTVIIGTLLMSSLLACYICVFRQLCCSRESDMAHRHNRGGKRASGPSRFDSVNLNELTHISSQPTETERI